MRHTHAYNQRILRVTSCVLAVLLLLSALCVTGCGTENSEDESGTTAASAAESSGETSTEKTADAALNRIGNPDWGGKSFTILYTNDITGYTDEIYAEDLGSASGNYGQGVSDAVYERNQLFETRCSLKLNLVGRDRINVANLLRQEVNSPADEYQLVTETTDTTALLATEGMLHDYLSLGNIDFDAPWWDVGTLDFALNGRVYFMNGAHNFVDDDVTFVMIFNKKMQSDRRIPDLYQTVRNSEWTLEYFNSVIQNVSNDSNGDGRMDENDTYGFTSPSTIGNTFFYGADMHYINNNRTMERPELALDDGAMHKATALLDIVRNITLDNNASWIAPGGSETIASNIFKSDRALFYCEAASYLTGLNKEMSRDYGVLPIPKYDKAQENYLTWAHAIGSTFSIPRSVGRTDILGDVLETFVVLSYQTVKPAYYDNMLTKKNVRDGESGEMLELIFQNRVYDMAVYFSSLGMAGLFAEAALTPSQQFASAYQKVSRSFPRRINAILQALDKTEKGN